MSGPPTLASEFKRGLNAFNLSVGFVTAVAGSGVAYALTRQLLIPDLFARGPGFQALLAGLLLMTLTTGLHTAGHAYFGWRFERGLRAFAKGDYPLAVRLLAVVEKPEMDHFDPEGYALKALQESRSFLRSKM